MTLGIVVAHVNLYYPKQISKKDLELSPGRGQMCHQAHSQCGHPVLESK